MKKAAGFDRLLFFIIGPRLQDNRGNPPKNNKWNVIVKKSWYTRIPNMIMLRSTANPDVGPSVLSEAGEPASPSAPCCTNNTNRCHWTHTKF